MFWRIRRSGLTGKPAGDDLREGKRTVLVALAWQRCNDAGRKLLTRVLAGDGAAMLRM
ncbi:polyprenyl synthetase family protein [Actinomyces ruminis]|uniref:polyprenyl synthetase family protein n=1 Tax=Actinomyces ruminis TaxID=1937003 RepID=UPI00211EDEDF|nr:polyprenyl synthetase family protein [Actinomyces ruminis]